MALQGNKPVGEGCIKQLCKLCCVAVRGVGGAEPYRDAATEQRDLQGRGQQALLSSRKVAWIAIVRAHLRRTFCVPLQLASP